ncbi:hypothetical protein [Spirillospora sp. CA-294931]|uniref:hypothetical protein n=1 Tax=Spirillospora sp. CA-294931 TaxID=3240042 RepID=UPI003D91E926
MRAVFSAWFAAGIVAAIALLALKALAPHVEPGVSVDEYAQIYRVHLPRLLFSILMAFVAGSYVREDYTALGRGLAALPVPLLVSVIGAVMDIPMSTTVVTLVLSLIEALLGVVLGLFLTRALSSRLDNGPWRHKGGGVWRESGP